MQELLSYNYKFYIEPEEPITNVTEFINELVKYFSSNNTFMTIVEESMEPIIKIGEETYICKLGEPLKTKKFLKIPIRSNSYRFLGYKWIYVYSYMGEDSIK